MRASPTRLALTSLSWCLARSPAADVEAPRSESECGREDSNLHPRRDRDLNPARLPFRHARRGCNRTSEA